MTHVSDFTALVGWISLRIHRQPVNGGCADAYPPYEFSHFGLVIQALKLELMI
jgi:hypothetical protein